MIKSISFRIYECIGVFILRLDFLLYVIVNTTERSFTSDSSVKINLLLLLRIITIIWHICYTLTYFWQLICNHVMVWYGTVRYGTVRYGTVRYGTVRYGTVLYGIVRYGMVWYGMVWYGMVWYGMVWYGMVWYGMVWYGMVWYGMVWYGMSG